IAAAHELESATDQRLMEPDNHFEGPRAAHRQARFTEPRNWRSSANPLRPSWAQPYRAPFSPVTQAVHQPRADAAGRGAARALHRARAGAEGREAVLVLHQLPFWRTRRSAEGKPLPHDPRRRQCGLCSVTSFRFGGPHLAGVDYAEPAAALYAGAVDATGGKLA